MISIDEQIAYQREPWGSGEHEVAILATLQSIKDAGDAVVEPEYLIRLRNALKGFKSDGAFAGDKDIVDYIDSLRDLLRRETAKHEGAADGWKYWRERAEAAERQLAAMLKLGENPSESVVAVGVVRMRIGYPASSVFTAMFAKLIEQAGVKK